ncbi:HlyC/CorC family transporter [Ostreibacterium oceani]|uniref:HlyC/CorC family transporter n=1 Tax=Ostreibacterium oceani TaxID=2654998 RepID=UPI001C40807C|nr:CNNM domain-containing protein [Ostreibacterium oceani]
MSSIPTYLLVIILVLLLFCSAFFSGSETSMMRLNRHRLKHLAQTGDIRAARALALLKRPDRLLGVILLGNNIINIFAASLATIIGLRLWGDAGIFIMTLVLTLLILIFGEVAPKTFAALYAEKFAFPASWFLRVLLKLLYPVVWMVNLLANAVLKPLGLKHFTMSDAAVSKEELQAILQESYAEQGENHQDMMLGLLYLEDINVEDIMVARRDIIGLDMTDDWTNCQQRILSSEHSRLLVYQGNVDEIIGVLNIRDVLCIYRDSLALDKTNVTPLIRKAYFVPEGTSLRKQLQQFQYHQHQTGIVVNEYGEVIGLLTLEDILEYVVGDLGLQEIAEAESADEEDIIQKSAGIYQVQGKLSINYLNKELDWELPTDGPKTLSGLILEELGVFPSVGTKVSVGRYELSVLSFSDNRVQQVLVTVLADDED